MLTRAWGGRLTGVALSAALLVAPGSAWPQAVRPIRIGQSADFSGPQAASVNEATAAARAYFDSVNERGGVHGRRIVLESLDDGFEPQRTVANARRLVAEHQVAALFLMRGTANAEALVPVLPELRVPMFAAVAGSRQLHEPADRLVFNLRPPYRTEVQRAIEQLATTGARRIAVAYTDDPFGRDALEGARAGLLRHRLEAAALVPMPRGATDVAAPTEALRKADAEAVIGLCIPRTCAELVRRLRELGSTAQFVSLSNTASASYVQQLGRHARGVIVSQVFPDPKSARSPLVEDYQKLARARGLAESYTSMEGYLAARVMVEALRRAGPAGGTDRLVAAFESMRDFDLGGFHVSYGPGDRTASEFVELTMIGADGRFVR